MADEIRIIKPRKAIASVLVIVAILAMSVVLDYASEERMMGAIEEWHKSKENYLLELVRTEMDDQFETLSERKGAWTLDRPMILGKLGMKVEEMPSFNSDYGDPKIGNGHKK